MGVGCYEDNQINEWGLIVIISYAPYTYIYISIHNKDSFN